jgi:uncharacterized protein (TIGR03118 family)
VPYGIQNIGGELFVTYKGEGYSSHGGAVAEFNTDGTFVRQFSTKHAKVKLQAPWGVALAPGGFGRYSNDFLVGDFGSGRIYAFSQTGKARGVLKGTNNRPIVIPGLWALAFGNGQKGGPTNTLIFTAGIDNQTHGLFGSLQATTITR